jgi:RNA-binding protein YhbY
MDAQRRVMEFIQTIEKPLSSRELMKLPYEERMRRARAALARTVEEDVELFE